MEQVKVLNAGEGEEVGVGAFPRLADGHGGSTSVRHAWTFEVRFSEPQPIHKRSAWCADESVMAALRRQQDAQEVTPPGESPNALERFLQGPPALEPAGTPEFCSRVEQWVRVEAGV